MTEFYFKIEGILHGGEKLPATTALDKIVQHINGLSMGLDVTHTETAMMLPSGEKMEYSVED